MLSGAARRYAALPTAAKLLLILTAVVLPIGLGLVWVAYDGIRDANNVLRQRSIEHSRLAARAIESLIARNALALRIAANGRINSRNACDTVQRALSVTPAVAQGFALQDTQGTWICSVGGFELPAGLPIIAPGDIRLRIGDDGGSLIVRVGVIGGIATEVVPVADVRSAARQAGEGLGSLVIRDGTRQLTVINREQSGEQELADLVSEWPMANGQLVARVGAPVPRVTTAERLMLLLPLVMWILAALITWLLVTRLLIRPLRRLQRAVIGFQPGDEAFILPQKLGPATEILELRDAFARAVERVDQSEQEMAGALEGQRRLVREVHHRVKNNLQVVASLLNIHGRSAESPAAREAYASISRRVGALSVVHRNHFAEMEENRGIALRPLLSELAAELRATAPETARSLRIDLELDSANTTQDVAVSVAFLVTEIVEFAMLQRPEDPVEISLRRTSDLTAELSLGSSVLVPEQSGEAENVQFERIISGLAKQLRSDLERRLGRYSVDLPIFPPQ